MTIGSKVTLRDGTEVIVIEIPSDRFFIGQQPNGVTGIFYVNQIAQ